MDGKSFVTARGWSDLSDMIRLFEQNGLTVDESLAGQYLQNRRIARDFAVYYDLFNKYRADYQVDAILAGQTDPEVLARAQKAAFDERLSLLGLLLDAVTGELHAIFREEAAQTGLLSALKTVKMELTRPAADVPAALERQIESREKALETGKRAGTLSADEEFALRSAMAALGEERALLARERPTDAGAAFRLLKGDFDGRTRSLKEHIARGKEMLSHLFRFCETAFAEGQEMVILVTELTISYYGARFISRHGCEEYYAHNRELLFYEREREITAELEKLELE